MGKCVGAPHPDTFPYTFPHPFPIRQHTSSPHALSYPPTHSPHTLYHTSPLPTRLSLSPPTPQDISLHLPHTSSHSSFDLPLHPNTLPHSSHALSPHLPPQFRLCGEVMPHSHLTRKRQKRKISRGNGSGAAESRKSVAES